VPTAIVSRGQRIEGERSNAQHDLLIVRYNRHGGGRSTALYHIMN